ncbi:metallophosphoesterase family protein [Nocardiopsis ansamitocini]|uniref:Metallophosphoesterase n=1 Tax=Nocardiopsis ansamitocini TaxID=1670832 RepID=A0A9W6P7S4_9ACTN|nr:metallophosphoesterase [Nocardiopsis ansamitocini]GLU48563.1 metallophosphoesterase [Nocardiopsis ansamitocini]
MAARPSVLFAVSDLHVSHRDNRPVLDTIRPEGPEDWLLVAGDVAETIEDVEWALRQLRDRFAQVVWVPGNHELWSPRDRADVPRGEDRYLALVEMCRSLGVLTPEDDYPVWRGAGGPVTVAPLFLLYDYTWRPEGTSTPEEALAYAHKTGVVCSDEFLLDPSPYLSRQAWCAARVASTAARLAACDPDLSTVLVNHYPLVREPTRILHYPEFAQWCGTEHTADWHRRFRAAAVVYGHLHIPRVTVHDGVRFHEVSLGYPREWRARPAPPVLPHRIL